MCVCQVVIGCDGTRFNEDETLRLVISNLLGPDSAWGHVEKDTYMRQSLKGEEK